MEKEDKKVVPLPVRERSQRRQRVPHEKGVRMGDVSSDRLRSDGMREELMHMTEVQITQLFERYDFLDALGHPLESLMWFKELVKIAVEGSACLQQKRAADERVS